MSTIFIFGNYSYKETFLHQLDPRSKLLFLIIFSLSVFLASNNITLLVYVLIALLFTIVSKFSFLDILKGLLPVSPFLLFSFILQMLFYGEGEVLYSFSFITVYYEGLLLGSIYIIKIGSVLVIAALVTNSTKPIVLTEGIKFFLFPLKFIGLPVRDIATSISIAITFIPFIFDEAIIIRNAQIIRGGKISLLKFHLFVISIVLPIILNTLDRSEKLALSMELRGYNLNPNEIRFTNLSWSSKDSLLIFTSIFLFLPVLIQ